MNSIGWEVSEDIFASLIEACIRSGEAQNSAQAVIMLKSHGIQVMMFASVCSNVMVSGGASYGSYFKPTP